MSETRVIHVSETDQFPGATYIGRANNRKGLKASPFANPFVIGKDGDREEVIERYAAHLTLRPDLIRRLPELRHRPLACWCRKSTEPRTLDSRCHGDVLLELLDQYDDETLATWPDRREEYNPVHLRQVPESVLRRW